MNIGKKFNIKKINQSIAEYLQAFDSLQKTIFSFYIKRDYFSNQMVYEKNFIQETSVFMRAMQRARLQLEDIKHIAILSVLEHLYEILFSLDLFKLRFLDHSTFEMCENELKNTSDMMTAVINDMLYFLKHKDTHALKNAADKQFLARPIHALEILFENTFQFAMADPYMFLFFIRDLQALNEELIRLHAKTLELHDEAYL